MLLLWTARPQLWIIRLKQQSPIWLARVLKCPSSLFILLLADNMPLFWPNHCLLEATHVGYTVYIKRLNNYQKLVNVSCSNISFTHALVFFWQKQRLLSWENQVNIVRKENHFFFLWYFFLLILYIVGWFTFMHSISCFHSIHMVAYINVYKE